MALEAFGKENDAELCAIDLNYKKKQWKNLEEFSSEISMNAVKSAIEQQIPNFHKRLKQRHLKLKGIYAHCKKQHFSSQAPLELPKVGRNEPCPCGSGKKYKKCCMRKSN